MKGRKKRLALLLCMALATNIFVPGGGRAYALETVTESGDAALESLAAPETGNADKSTSGTEPGVSAVSGSDAVLLSAKGVEAADPQGEMLVYYIDAEAGDDAADGLSAETPWKSLEKINETVFQPGDCILFKAGCSWTGQLWPKGSGTEEAPIRIDRYGEGAAPLIIGTATMDKETDQDFYKGAAVVLHNQEYWEISSLEITNTDPITSTGPDADVSLLTKNRRIGVAVTTRSPGDGKETYHHIYLKDLYIHDISGEVGRDNGGILIRNQQGGNRTNFEDVQILNCTISNIVGNGITTSSDYVLQYMGTEETGGNPTRWGEFPGKTRVDWGSGPQFKSKDILISGCKLQNIWCDGILTINVDHPVIEYNVCDNACYAPGAYAAIWPHSSNDALIQFNEVSNTRFVGGDGQAFDVDYNCDNAIVQYNYSHDNEGGFLLLMESANYVTVRYNISVNDGVKGTAQGLLDIRAGNVSIYNNTFYSDAEVLATHVENGFSGNGVIANNIFYAKTPVNMPAWKTDSKASYVYHNNAIYGYTGLPEDDALVTADPGLKNPGTAGEGLNSVEGYGLKKTSPCIDSGMEIADNGGRDYLGNLLSDGAVDIGAIEASEKGEKADDIAVKASSVVISSQDNRRTVTQKEPTLQLYAEVLPFEADIHEVVWSVTSLDGKSTALAEISEEGLLTGIENGTVRVIATAADGSGAYGEMEITLQMKASSANQVVDDLNIDDFSKMYEHSGELWMDKNLGDYFGDYARLIRSNKYDTSFVRYATYHYERINGFVVTAYYQNYTNGEKQPIEDISFFVSADNENWRQVTAEEYETEDSEFRAGETESASVWTKRIYTCDTLEGGDNYFKVTFPQQYSEGKYYDPNIGQIILNLAAQVEEIRIETDKDAITEPEGEITCTAYAYPEGAAYSSVSWSVENPDGSQTTKASIDNQGKLKAYNNGTVIVKAVSTLDGSIEARKEITISGQPANILDTCRDFSVIWKQNGLQAEYVGWFAGGTHTIHPYGGSSDRYMIYKAGNIRGFRVNTNFLDGVERDLTFYGSEDGENFTELTNVAYDQTNLGGAKGRSYHMEQLADGVNYLKIQFAEGFSWEANITKVQLFFDDMTGMELKVTADSDRIDVYDGQLQMGTEPAGVAVTWSVTDENGLPTNKAQIDENGLLTGKSRGTVLVNAVAKADQSIMGSKEITIHTKVYQRMEDDFRYSEGYETGNADNLLQKTLHHSSGFWHQKVDWAGAYGLYVHDWMAPNFLEYSCENLAEFEVKTLCRYDFAEGADFVFKASEDGKNWVTLEGVTKSSSGGNWPIVTYSKKDMNSKYRFFRVEYPDAAQNAGSNINLCGVNLVSQIRVTQMTISADKGQTEDGEDQYVIPALGESIHFTAHTDTTAIPGMILWTVEDVEETAGVYRMQNTAAASTRASITQDGVLTAIDYGTVRVTAEAQDGSGVSCSVLVTIQSIHPENIVLNKQNKVMQVGDVLDLQYRIYPANAVEQSVTYLSENEEVVSVTQKGRVRALQAGETDIKVTTVDGGITAVCHVIVSDAKVCLEQLIAQCEALEETDYLEESWKPFAQTLAEAKAVLAAADSRKEDWNAASESLLSARDSLVGVEDAFGELTVLMRRAEALDFTLYTEESFAAVQSAYLNAQNVTAKGNMATRAEITEAANALQLALDGLTLKSTEEDQPGNNGGGNQGGNNQPGGSTGDDSKPGNGGAASGDNSGSGSNTGDNAGTTGGNNQPGSNTGNDNNQSGNKTENTQEPSAGNISDGSRSPATGEAGQFVLLFGGIGLLAGLSSLFLGKRYKKD